MKDDVFQRILERYLVGIQKGRFNGVKLLEVNENVSDAALRLIIEELVVERKIDIICSATQQNPHIKRHPVQTPDVQLQHLDVGEKYGTCLYPTEETIAKTYSLGFLNERPYTKELARGRHQLKPVFFEIGVIDRYRLDPRYSFRFTEYSGTISTRSESEKSGPIQERDQISIQTFGLGMDQNHNAVVCVFLRYLSQLSSEHQRHWETHTSDQPALMHANYYKPSYLGEPYENNSGMAALRISIKLINTVCEEVWGSRLFLNDVPQDVHYSLSPFVRAFKSDYLSFVHELDKLISENINASFFEGRIEPYSVVTHPDGTKERKPKGTLARLEEWLFSGEINWSDIDEARVEVIQPLRRIRRERQASAHTVIENEFDLKYIAMRRDIFLDAVFALGNILHVLKTHPQSPKIRIPKWFEEARIEVI